MRKFTAYLLSMILAFSFMFSIHTNVHADTEDDEYRILFLSSYSYAWDTVQIQIEGLTMLSLSVTMPHSGLRSNTSTIFLRAYL